MRDNRIIIAGVIIVLLAAGVVIVFTGDRGATPAVQVVSTVEEQVVENTEVVVAPTTNVSEPAPATETSEPVAPAPKAELSATDPGTVNLVSGNLQFVEAFAFW